MILTPISLRSLLDNVITTKNVIYDAPTMMVAQNGCWTQLGDNFVIMLNVYEDGFQIIVLEWCVQQWLLEKSILTLLKLLLFTMQGQQWLSKNHRRMGGDDNFIIIATILKTVSIKKSLKP